jgi:hypothetical protein
LSSARDIKSDAWSTGRATITQSIAKTSDFLEFSDDNTVAGRAFIIQLKKPVLPSADRRVLHPGSYLRREKHREVK